MHNDEITKLYADSKQAKAFMNLLENKSIKKVFLRGLSCSATPLFFASIAEKINSIAIFVLEDADSAGYFYHDLTQILGNQDIFYLPSSYKRAVKYGQKDPANEILRTEILTRLSTLATDKNESKQQRLFIVSYPEAIAELVVSKKNLDKQMLCLKVGQTIEMTTIGKTLHDFGFEEVDYVYQPGQFAMRGSIVDVYSFSHELPFRIDFFGDDIDSIRTFSVEDQFSKDKKTEITIVPELSRNAGGKVSLLSFMPQETLFVTKDSDYVRQTIRNTYEEGFSTQAVKEQLADAEDDERQTLKQEMKTENVLSSAEQFGQDISRLRQIEFRSNINKDAEIPDSEQKDAQFAVIRFHITPQPLFHKNFDLLKRALEDYLLLGYKLYILADSNKQQQRLKDIFDEMDSANDSAVEYERHPKITFTPIDKTIHEGFSDEDLKACFFTDHQIFDRFHKYSLKSDNARAGKAALTMKEIRAMSPGDFIVHLDYGIGKFSGLVRVPTQTGYQEVVRIIYKNNDKVDVSIHSLYKISKYRRQDTDQPPQLSTLGTGAWNRLKERAKKKIKSIARDLIKLYANRRQQKGFAFQPDDYLQHELEAGFMYEDTPDQVKATQDVKNDMESLRPMDRLICGDVGFGKTEVAIRASFKAATSGKQTAVLVPTTVLAFQHYQTFKERLKELPVRIDYLSRARSSKATREIMDDLSAGKIDILIGTHKLLSKNIKWKDLGLLIIDEEQKFGVSAKEKLRKLKNNIDTLTMSATPIPRTLQFSLMGARDMSIMRTPPPNRYPIQTELHQYGSEVIAEAINFEMSRNGQVFFVNNRIGNLEEIARLIKKHVPDCRIAIAHGQMEPEKMEKTLMDFINYDYDVLISTTIIENGIDISNANTIIINDAHRFGLSDLHQMRGRVGRSNKKAFCYLLAPPKSLLTAEARRRLEALETFSGLGNGFNIAMQDLDIRGAGNLLGAEQSGFMEEMGYETYEKVLTQAVSELKNEEFQDLYQEEIAQSVELNGEDFVDDCAVETDLESYFPDNYVPGSSERILLYRELDSIESDEELDRYRQQLIDRFGPVPPEAEELMHIVSLRKRGRHLGCEKISLLQGHMSMQFVSNPQSAFYKSSVFEKVLDYITANPKRCILKEVRGKRLLRVQEIHSVDEAVSVLKAIEKSD